MKTQIDSNLFVWTCSVQVLIQHNATATLPKQALCYGVGPDGKPKFFIWEFSATADRYHVIGTDCPEYAAKWLAMFHLGEPFENLPAFGTAALNMAVFSAKSHFNAAVQTLLLKMAFWNSEMSDAFDFYTNLMEEALRVSSPGYAPTTQPAPGDGAPSEVLRGTSEP